MDALTKEINRVLDHLDKERWISFSKNDSSLSFKAKDKLRAYGLIERHGKLSWQLTKEGYIAVELGGFHVWIKTQKQNKNPRKFIRLLSKFWWYLIIPIIVGIIVWALTQKKEPNPGKQSEVEHNSNNEAKIKAPYTESVSDDTVNLDNNRVYLQSFSPVELFKGDMIITLNNSVDVVNGGLELKLVKKTPLKTEILKNKKIGDVIRFNNYVITLLSLERNISTYDLLVRVETNE